MKRLFYKLAIVIMVWTYHGMKQLSASQLAAMLLSAPVWARAALSATDPLMRERAADTMAARVMAEINGEDDSDMRDAVASGNGSSLSI